MIDEKTPPKTDLSLFLIMLLIWTVQDVKYKIYDRTSVPWFWVLAPLWIPVALLILVALVKAVQDVKKKRKAVDPK